MQKKEQIVALSEALKSVAPTNEALKSLLESRGEAVPPGGARLIDLLKRPGIRFLDLLPLADGLENIDAEAAEQVELNARYEGYILKQNEQVERQRSLEELTLSPDTDYASMSGLRIEARQKLARFKPENIGRAARIPGVSPADVAVLIIQAKRKERERTPMDEFNKVLLDVLPGLNDAQARQFALYYDLLVERNKQVNLTAITGPIEGCRETLCRQRAAA